VMRDEDEQKRGRGRPATGHAKTDANRQAAYRARKKTEIEKLKRDVARNTPPAIGRLEAQIILLNADLIARSDKLDEARQQIYALQKEIRRLSVTSRKMRG